MDHGGNPAMSDFLIFILTQPGCIELPHGKLSHLLGHKSFRLEQYIVLYLYSV